MRRTSTGLTRFGVSGMVLACVALSLGCRPKPGGRGEGTGPAAPGALDFRILANRLDDKEAIKAACVFFIKARDDPARKADLEELARSGKPPPPPVPEKGDTFATELGHYTYAWVEIAPSERISLHLTPPPVNARYPGRGMEAFESAKKFREQVASAREQGDPLELEDMAGGLLYGRPCQDTNLSAEEREQKGWDYFLLLRNPDGEDEAVTGEDLVAANPSRSESGTPAVGIRLSPTGGARFYRLTSKNAPEPEGFRRFLAVVFDGRVVSAPSLNARIRDGAIISGDFTPTEVDNYVTPLRGGRARDSR